MLARVLASVALVPALGMKCPGSKSFLHAWAKLEALADTSCQERNKHWPHAWGHLMFKSKQTQVVAFLLGVCLRKFELVPYYSKDDRTSAGCDGRDQGPGERGLARSTQRGHLLFGE